MNKASILTVIVVILAGVSVAMAGLIVEVYTPQIQEQNQQLAEQDEQMDQMGTQISDLNKQVDDLQGELSDMRAKYTANLVTGLGINDVGNSSDRHLYITGTVTNNGVTAAYNAGLHIVGYGSNHEKIIDLTSNLGYEVFQNGFSGSSQLGTVYPTQVVSVQISIFHSGTVESWDLTPVWNN